MTAAKKYITKQVENALRDQYSQNKLALNEDENEDANEEETRLYMQTVKSLPVFLRNSRSGA